MRHAVLVVVMVCAAIVAASAKSDDWDPIRTVPPTPDRYTKFTKFAATGPLMKPVAATFFGTAGHEEFIGAIETDDSIIAIGNSWGPKFPDAPAPIVWGKGHHQGLPAIGAKPAQLNRAQADVAGMLVFYGPDLQRINKVVRFDWGVASLWAAMQSADGKGIILLGLSGPDFKSVVEPLGPAKAGAELAAGGGDTFVMRVSADATKIEWVYVEGQAGKPAEEIRTDKQGLIYYDAKQLVRLSADGKKREMMSKYTGSSTAKWLAVDPADGSAYFGGDRNTHTHREPWRQPYLYKISATGEKVWSLWEFAPADVGSDHGGLESDSSVRNIAWTHTGQMIVGGWSDGANSCFPRMCTDWKHYAPEGGYEMLPWWPHGANSIGHIMRLDPVKKETLSHQWWVTYPPENFEAEKSRNRPGSTQISQIVCLADDSVALTGGAVTGFIQTPNAFWKDPLTGKKHGGNCVAILTADMKQYRFSSFMPGCSNLHLAAGKTGLIVTGRSVGTDGAPDPTASPSIRAIQPFAGETDAHIMVIRE